MDAVEDALITISGGTIIVNASGDGLDSNGNAVMTGGTVLVSGSTNGGNGALDYNGTFNISGGILVAAGATGMVQATSTSSSQACINYTFSATQSANSLICLRDANGNDIVAFNPAKTYQNVIISASALSIGFTYSL